MSSHHENHVPKGPPDLCFDTSSFVRETFLVDQFLQEHCNKASLETMRDDLGIYLKVLRSAMIDLINKDYADFVNLSSNLIGLDKAIGDIQLPLGQLREELLEVGESLGRAAGEISSQLSRKRELRERKRSLKSLNRVQTSLKRLKLLLPSPDSSDIPHMDVLERVASEYNQIQFHIARCSSHVSKSHVKSFNDIGDTLINCINKLFLETVGQGEKGQADLLRLLLLYQSLDKIQVAERLYRKEVVSPALENVICEETLRSTATGLPGLFDRVLSFIDNDMNHVLKVTAQYNLISTKSKFDFFLKSFWPEVEERMEMNLSSIFSPGDPDVFYQRYTETMSFLEALLARNGSPKCIIELQSDPNFVDFMEKWDLPVYFQIRFLEIVRDLELSFEKNPWASNSGRWKLIASETVWKSLNKCWDDGVYLFPIAQKFWKLSLQIISRFTTWTKSIDGSLKSRSQDVNFLVFLYSDVEHLTNELISFMNIVMKRLPKISDNTSQLLTRSLEESRTRLVEQLERLSREITRSLSSPGLGLVRQVNDIPRLYRRTNREAPTKPCSYVSSLLEGPASFHRLHSSHPNATHWLTTAFSTLTSQYYTSVSEVLESVQKTEESLRRLKKARDRSSNLAPNDRRIEDDNKIRLQLHLDVTAFLQGIEKLGIKKGNVEKLTDLLLLVEATQQS